MKIMFYLLFYTLLINASQKVIPLSLENAINILKSNNLEIQTAALNIEASKMDTSIVSGSNWGTLNFIQDFSRSNDAGNVFGFKLTSREATFGDFGFSEFNPANPNILSVQPQDLNYPGYRNFFQSKLKYELPLFTGFKLSSYAEIMQSMTKIKRLEKKEKVDEKIYQLRKSFFDMALLRESAKNLNKILNNIGTLEKTTNEMIKVGYAKKIDLLEVQAKKGNVQRLLTQVNLNKKLLLQYISFLLNQKIMDISTPTMDVKMPAYSDETILQRNLDIKRATMGLKISNKMVDIAKASYYPTLGAFGEVSTADNTLLGNAQDHKAYTVGARLSWNVFNGGIDNANLEKSRIEKLRTSLQVELAKKGIALKISKLKTQIATFDKQIMYLEEELDLANEIYKNYVGRYREKLSSINDVMIKQSQQIEKILLLQQAHNERNERIFALEKLANGEEI